MNTEKRLLPIYLLRILHERSDEKHRLSQKEIISQIKNEYDIVVD